MKFTFSMSSFNMSSKPTGWFLVQRRLRAIYQGILIFLHQFMFDLAVLKFMFFPPFSVVYVQIPWQDRGSFGLFSPTCVNWCGKQHLWSNLNRLEKRFQENHVLANVFQQFKNWFHSHYKYIRTFSKYGKPRRTKTYLHLSIIKCILKLKIKWKLTQNIVYNNNNKLYW